jgi:hypothetical protein
MVNITHLLSMVSRQKLAKLAARPQLRSQRDTVFLTFSFNRLRGMPTR